MRYQYIQTPQESVCSRTRRNWKIAYYIACNFLIFTIYPMTSLADPSTRATDYGLQERCGITSARWAKEHNEVTKYESYYNNKQNKCIIYATLAPILSDNVTSSYYMVYDPNANKTLAQYTVRSGPNYEDRICIVNGKRIDGVSDVKWNGIVRNLIGE